MGNYLLLSDWEERRRVLEEEGAIVKVRLANNNGGPRIGTTSLGHVEEIVTVKPDHQLNSESDPYLLPVIRFSKVYSTRTHSPSNHKRYGQEKPRKIVRR